MVVFRRVSLYKLNKSLYKNWIVQIPIETDELKNTYSMKRKLGKVNILEPWKCRKLAQSRLISSFTCVRKLGSHQWITPHKNKEPYTDKNYSFYSQTFGKHLLERDKKCLRECKMMTNRVSKFAQSY